jgi:hypothetical protein
VCPGFISGGGQKMFRRGRKIEGGQNHSRKAVKNVLQREKHLIIENRGGAPNKIFVHLSASTFSAPYFH